MPLGGAVVRLSRSRRKGGGDIALWLRLQSPKISGVRPQPGAPHEHRLREGLPWRGFDPAEPGGATGDLQRERAEAHTRIPFPVWPTPNDGADGASGILVILFLLVVVPVVVRLLAWIPALAFLAVGAFLSSFLSGLILVAGVPVLIGRRLPYRAARLASFAGLLRYLVVTAILTFCAVLVSAFDTSDFARSMERLSNSTVLAGGDRDSRAVLDRRDWSRLAACGPRRRRRSLVG